MKCAVITPVGPGHKTLYRQCQHSIQAAVDQNKGPFEEVVLLPVDDLEGKLGRSAARNIGIQEAAKRECEWLFFLDADDIMLADTFSVITPYLADYDAVWGNIAEIEPGGEQAVLRIPQVLTIASLQELIVFDPFYTIQMGHFVKTAVAMQHLFDETMDCGEDFKYYLNIWSRYKCRKIQQPLFVNRRGLHSQGIRSATGRQWRLAVEQLLAAYQKGEGICSGDKQVAEIARTKSLEYSVFSKQTSIAKNNLFVKLLKIYE